MIKFISANGMYDGSGYYHFTIEGGRGEYCIGDQVWMNATEMEISEMVDDEVVEELLCMCDRKSGMALKGSLRRVGIL